MLGTVVTGNLYLTSFSHTRSVKKLLGARKELRRLGYSPCRPARGGQKSYAHAVLKCLRCHLAMHSFINIYSSEQNKD